MNKKSTGLLLSTLGVLSLVLITTGVTYAFFTYAKEGTTENSLTTGTLTFYYDEKEAVGNGIKIEDAVPMSDTDGKAIDATVAEKAFKFKVVSTTVGNASINYTVTAREKTGSDETLRNQMKLYLTANESGSANVATTDVNATTNPDGTVKLFRTLTPYGKKPAGSYENVLYTGTVEANQNYANEFTLRMWLSNTSQGGTTADYSPYEFVKKTAVTAAGTNAMNASTLIDSGDLITSTAYYGLDSTNRALYERVSYVNEDDKTFYSVSQTTANGGTAAMVTPDTTKYTANEQIYMLNGQTYTVMVNVYANATVVPAPTNVPEATE